MYKLIKNWWCEVLNYNSKWFLIRVYFTCDGLSQKYEGRSFNGKVSLRSHSSPANNSAETKNRKVVLEWSSLLNCKGLFKVLCSFSILSVLVIGCAACCLAVSSSRKNLSSYFCFYHIFLSNHNSSFFLPSSSSKKNKINKQNEIIKKNKQNKK